MRFLNKILEKLNKGIEAIRRKRQARSKPSDTTVQTVPVQIIEALEDPTNEAISVEITVHAPASTQAKVTVAIDVSASVAAPANPDDKHRKTWAHREEDFCYETEGIGLTPDTKYHTVFTPQTLALSSEEKPELPDRVDNLVFRSEQPYYEGYLEQLSLQDDDSDTLISGYSATPKQLLVYSQLCELCRQTGIEYNHRDRPESFREYQIAIMSLKKALRRKNAFSYQQARG